LAKINSGFRIQDSGFRIQDSGVSFPVRLDRALVDIIGHVVLMDFEIIPIEAVRDRIFGGMGAGVRR
jgi:hypothetical protein